MNPLREGAIPPRGKPRGSLARFLWLLYGIGDIFGSKLTRLRFVRDELGLSQKEMASQLGISAQYLGLMERGDQPISLPVAQNVEKLYGYRAEWILFEKGPMKY